MSNERGMMPVDAWSIVTATSLHFNPERKFDALKYNFKGPRCSRDAFEKNRNRFLFEKLAKKYPKKNDIILYSVSNILAGQKWINTYDDIHYQQWQAKIQSLEYNFKEDIDRLAVVAKNNSVDFDSLIMPPDLAKMPSIYRLLQTNNISLETAALLDILVSYTGDLTNKLIDPLSVSSSMSAMISSYKPFLSQIANRDRLGEIVTKAFG